VHAHLVHQAPAVVELGQFADAWEIHRPSTLAKRR
jgi:hypothetical protein